MAVPPKCTESPEKRRAQATHNVHSLSATLHAQCINITVYLGGKLQSQQTNICFETPKCKQINSLECYLISMFIYFNFKCQRNAIYKMISFKKKVSNCNIYSTYKKLWIFFHFNRCYSSIRTSPALLCIAAVASTPSRRRRRAAAPDCSRGGCF